MADQFPERDVIIIAGIFVLIVLANIIGSHRQTASEQQLVELFFPPGLAQYGVVGVFFQLTGSSILFIILFVTIVLSLFIRRPWCRFACPIDGVLAYVRALRN